MRSGFTRRDIGRRMQWSDLLDFLRWLPPTGESALYRARKPNSWWVTPELQLMSAVLYALEGANWQRAGGKGAQPTPVKFPADRKRKTMTQDELDARKSYIKEGR